jgi:hypothetical protein
MDDLSDALERAAQFTRFENQQRYMRWMIAMRREILRLRGRDLRQPAATDSLSAGDFNSKSAMRTARKIPGFG